jgi:hypothetical protein
METGHQFPGTWLSRRGRVEKLSWSDGECSEMASASMGTESSERAEGWFDCHGITIQLDCLSYKLCRF